MSLLSEVSTGQLGPLQVDPSGVAGVARGLRVKVEMERRGAGHHVVLSSRHAERVENVPAEPDTQSPSCLSPISHLVKDCSGFLPFMLASGMRMKSLPSVLQVLAVLQSLLQPTPFRSQPSGDLVGLNLQSGQVRSGQGR